MTLLPLLLVVGLLLMELGGVLIPSPSLSEVRSMEVSSGRLWMNGIAVGFEVVLSLFLLALGVAGLFGGAWLGALWIALSILGLWHSWRSSSEAFRRISLRSRLSRQKGDY